MENKCVGECIPLPALLTAVECDQLNSVSRGLQTIISLETKLNVY